MRLHMYGDPDDVGQTEMSEADVRDLTNLLPIPLVTIKVEARWKHISGDPFNATLHVAPLVSALRVTQFGSAQVWGSNGAVRPG